MNRKYTEAEFLGDLRKLAGKDPYQDPAKLVEKAMGRAGGDGRFAAKWWATGWTSRTTFPEANEEDFRAYELAAWYLQEARKAA